VRLLRLKFREPVVGDDDEEADDEKETDDEDDEDAKDGEAGGEF
jgi:hypothetical protein